MTNPSSSSAQCFIEKTVLLAQTGPKQKKLFSIVDQYTILAFLAFPIIFGVETYYENALHADKTIYIGGFFSAVYLLILLLAFFRKRKALNRWRLVSSAGLQQKIKFTETGIETEEVIGCKIFRPWILVRKFRITKHTISIITEGSSTVLISKSYFNSEELSTASDLLHRNIKNRA